MNTQAHIMIETLLIGLAESAIKTFVSSNGETDGVNSIVYLDGLHGVVDIDGCTDILSAVVGIDGELSFLISNADDSKQMFVSFFDLNFDAAKKILDQILSFGTEFEE